MRRVAATSWTHACGARSASAVAVLRAREYPSPRFWLAAALGAVAAVVFAATQATGPGGVGAADLLLFGAVASAAVGYAEGGLLARELGAWQTVSWALVLSAGQPDPAGSAGAESVLGVRAARRAADLDHGDEYSQLAS